MTARQAAGLEPMQPALRLHGCHRVGNQITGLDLASPEARDRTVIVVHPLPLSFAMMEQARLIEQAKRRLFDDVMAMLASEQATARQRTVGDLVAAVAT